MITEIKHPLIQHKLTLMRKKETTTKDFRELLNEISMLMVYEMTRNFEVKKNEIETPVAKCKANVLVEENIVIVPILRAGLGMSGGVLKMFPNASVGHIGLYRDPKTLKPVEYYCKMPSDIDKRTLIVVDPMLATGGSSSAALTLLKNKGAAKIIFMCLVAAPTGIEVVERDHPDVPIFTASIDEKLNDHAYIVPGLGDAGDRIFGTF